MSFGVVPLQQQLRRAGIDRRIVLGRFDPEIPRRRRGLVASRVATAMGLVRAVMETLSYLHEPRLQPPPKQLPSSRR